jgi:hypothetical protein
MMVLAEARLPSSRNDPRTGNRDQHGSHECAGDSRALRTPSRCLSSRRPDHGAVLEHYASSAQAT